MYKNTKHYRYTVHRYLDSIWKVSSRRGKARSTMYSWLSTQMDLPEEETHVAKFTRNQCKQAIKILRPKYIELFGEDLSYRKKNEMKLNLENYEMELDKKIKVRGEFINRELSLIEKDILTKFHRCYPKYKVAHLIENDENVCDCFYNFAKK